MRKRRYVSQVRAAAAAESRSQVVNAAAGLLREHAFSGFSLEAVAKAAGVTRLTVYNQFGSRRGLLEAVFDNLADKGGLGRLPGVMALSDPCEALDALVDLFCRFWASDPVIGRMNEAIAIEAEFGEAVAERNERRRAAVSAVVEKLSAGSKIQKQRKQEAVDVIFGLTSYGMFKALATKRKEDAVRRLLKETCVAALDALLPNS